MVMVFVERQANMTRILSRKQEGYKPIVSMIALTISLLDEEIVNKLSPAKKQQRIQRIIEQLNVVRSTNLSLHIDYAYKIKYSCNFNDSFFPIEYPKASYFGDVSNGEVKFTREWYKNLGREIPKDTKFLLPSVEEANEYFTEKYGVDNNVYYKPTTGWLTAKTNDIGETEVS